MISMTMVIWEDTAMKMLYRSDTDRILYGVCGGIAEYMNTNSFYVRFIAAFLCLTPAGIIAYLLAALVIPVK